jgi:GNAT superfamily N-acetyltransferase
MLGTASSSSTTRAGIPGRSEAEKSGAVSEWQGRGLGAGLLHDAHARTLQVADIVGVRALAIHAKDDDAASFYRHFGFMPSNTDPRHLFMLIKGDLEKLP